VAVRLVSQKLASSQENSAAITRSAPNVFRCNTQATAPLLPQLRLVCGEPSEFLNPKMDGFDEKKVFYGTTSGPLQGCRALRVPEVSTARTGPGLPRGHTAAERRGISGDLHKRFFSAYCTNDKVLDRAGCEPAVPTWG